jgi:hypothetical protein
MARSSLAVGAALLGLAALRGDPPGPPLPAIERVFADAWDLRSQIDVTRTRGAETNLEGTPLAELRRRYGDARSRLQALLARASPPPADSDDGRALGRMKTVLENDLTEDPRPAEGTAVPPEVACDYDPDRLLSGPEGADTLWKRAYACYTRAAQALPFEGRSLDRGTVNARLTAAEDPVERRRLFFALSPLWKAVDGDGGRTSPYRALLRSTGGRWHMEGTSPDENLTALGVSPALAEGWLTSALARWSESTDATPIEPWDFWYRMSGASRALSPGLTTVRLKEVNASFYRSVGADPAVLGIHFDVEPRPARPPQPYSFTTFGRASREVDGAWRPGEFWVFANYAGGGFDDLAELLHETGHAIHIAAIRTRPAFADWPDSDLLTEALADFLGAEAYEPEWQRRFLGRSATLDECLRAKYSGIVMDMAWALLEARMRREPTADPNHVWTELTSRYLHVVPHPELSWWATRGQLIESPGYMMNYGAGAIVVAELRQRARASRGPFANGDPTWYTWLSERLYRFGRERPSERVILGFLGHPLSPDALLADLGRTGGGTGSTTPGGR